MKAGNGKRLMISRDEGKKKKKRGTAGGGREGGLLTFVSSLGNFPSCIINYIAIQLIYIGSGARDSRSIVSRRRCRAYIV